jgi:AhpD family alkylhydroperoxidase
LARLVPALRYLIYLFQPGSRVAARAANPRSLVVEKIMTTEPRWATVKPVSDADAQGAVAEIFADIKRTKQIDFVPNFWRVLATNPVQLQMVWSALKTLMHPEAVGRVSPLDGPTREIIALAVSATNGCSYCVNSHTAALRKLGLSTVALGEVLAIAGLFNLTNTLAEGYQVEPDVLPPLDA